MISIFAVSIGLFLIEPHSSQALQYDRVAIDAGEWFRLISGHFLHTNFAHLAFNLIGFLLLWALHGDDYSISNNLILFTYLCLSVSFSIYFFSPELSLYVGLSGVLHGLFCWGVIQDIRKKMITGYLLFLGAVLKIGSEQLYGAGTLMPSLIEADVAVDSHLYGAIFGTIGGMVSALFSHKYKAA